MALGIGETSEESSYAESSRVFPILIVFFLFSGATSLIYEHVWTRRLNLILGTSQLAVCIVLSGFFVGMALGAWIVGRYSYRIRRPIFIYGILELFIGIYALVFPSLLDWTAETYLNFWSTLESSSLVFSIGQFLLVGLLIVPPAACMGATFPVLSGPYEEDENRIGNHVGKLYGANTLGAVLGILFSGFYLLPQLGLAQTHWVAIGLNFLLFLAAIIVSLRFPGPYSRVAEKSRVRSKGSGVPLKYFWVAGLMGFAGLLAEVAWFRVLTLTLGGSHYAFSIMLLAFLLGIGIGGWFGGRLADQVYEKQGIQGVFFCFFLVQFSTAFLCWGTLYWFPELPYAFLVLFKYMHSSLFLFKVTEFSLALSVMLLPTLLMGVSFPLLIRMVTAESAEIEKPVGPLYSCNTLGCAVGAALGGLIILPKLQVTGSVILVASIYLFLVLICVQFFPRGNGIYRFFSRALLTFLLFGIGCAWWIFPPYWNVLLMSSGVFKDAVDMNFHSKSEFLNKSVRSHELLFYDEGISSVVTVGRSSSGDNIWLANNGKVDASSLGDANTQVLLAQLPLMFMPNAKKVLVIGYASGMTTGSVVLHPDVESIDVAELEPAIIEASHFFNEHNGRPLEDPRVHIHLNDGRNHLLRSPDGKYDLIISEPSNPWITGVSNLFTHEFFELGRRKLHPDGIWTQWIHAYRMRFEDLVSLLLTFHDVYPHAIAFRSLQNDLILLGSRRIWPMTSATFENFYNKGSVIKDDMERIGIPNRVELLKLFLLSNTGFRLLPQETIRNSDENMRIEFSAPLHLHQDTAKKNWAALSPMLEAPIDALISPEEFLTLANHFGIVDNSYSRMFQTLERARNLYHDHPDIKDLYEIIRPLWEKERAR